MSRKFPCAPRIVIVWKTDILIDMPLDNAETSREQLSSPNEFLPGNIEKLIQDPDVVRHALDWFRDSMAHAQQNSVTEEHISSVSNASPVLFYLSELVLQVLDATVIQIQKGRKPDAATPLDEAAKSKLMEEVSQFQRLFAEDPSVLFKIPTLELSPETIQFLLSERLLVDQAEQLKKITTIYLQNQYAQHFIQNVAPALGDTIKRVEQNMVVTQSEQWDKEKFRYNRIGQVHVIGRAYSRKNEPETFLNDATAVVHELLHAITYEILDLKEFKADAETGEPRKNFVELMLTDISVLRVLLEGISLAFHLEFTHSMSQKSSSPEVAKAMKKTHTDTLKSLAHEGHRSAYSEGFRIALALKHNGWTLNDLPELLGKLKALYASSKQMVGGEMIQGVQLLNVIPYRKDEDGADSAEYDQNFENLLEKIRGLQKSDIMPT
jgi:hypothetical protein